MSRPPAYDQLKKEFGQTLRASKMLENWRREYISIALKPAPAGDTTANANFLRNSKSVIIGELYPNEAAAIPRPKHVLEFRG